MKFGKNKKHSPRQKNDLFLIKNIACKYSMPTRICQVFTTLNLTYSSWHTVLSNFVKFDNDNENDNFIVNCHDNEIDNDKNLFLNSFCIIHREIQLKKF